MRKGFTMIELLIVVAILGVLALVLILNVNRFVERAEAESPYDNVYEIETYSGNRSVLLTTKTLPTVESGFLKVENYWWREWDEEGNVEWLRYDNDNYYILYPIECAVIIRHIPDKYNTAHIVIFGEE